VHLVAVAWAWAYNTGLKSTVTSFVPYAAAFGLLPVFVSLGRPGSPLGPWWAPTAAALLGTGAHLMNTLPDLERDATAGIRGLPHLLGRARSLAAAALLLLAAAGVLALATGHVGILGACSVAASLAGVGTAVLVAARRPSSRLPFGLTIGVALVDVGMLLADGRGLH
jgi:4-hydroxybenzoate polyprenyltransferase